jgi:hypothetical protein
MDVKRPRLALCGPSGAGKDWAAEWLVEHAGYRYTGGTSTVIAPFIAEEDGITVEQAMAKRHQERDRWLKKGDELCGHDPAFLVRKVMEGSDICVGIRRPKEFDVAESQGLFDVSIWIARDGGRFDTTMLYTKDRCDIILLNEGEGSRFAWRLLRLANSWGLLTAPLNTLP